MLLFFTDKKIDKRRQFTLEEKKRILECIDSGWTQSGIARQFSIPKSTLSGIIRDRSKIESNIIDGQLNPNRKKMRGAVHDTIEKAIFSWYQELRSRNIHVNGPMIKDEALNIARLHGNESFQPTSSWLSRFCDRYSVSLRMKESNSPPTVGDYIIP